MASCNDFEDKTSVSPSAFSNTGELEVDHCGCRIGFARVIPILVEVGMSEDDIEA